MTKRTRSQFSRALLTQTPLLQMSLLLIALWLVFSAGVYFTERDIEGTTINSYSRALYWGVAAFLIEHMEQIKDRKLRIHTKRSHQGKADLRKGA